MPHCSRRSIAGFSSLTTSSWPVHTQSCRRRAPETHQPTPLNPDRQNHASPSLSLHSSASCPAVLHATAGRPANGLPGRASKATWRPLHWPAWRRGPNTVVGRPVLPHLPSLLPPDLTPTPDHVAPCASQRSTTQSAN